MTDVLPVRQAARLDRFSDLGHVVGPRPGGGAGCLCGWSGPLYQAGVHLLRVNATQLETRLSEARHAGLIR